MTKFLCALGALFAAVAIAAVADAQQTCPPGQENANYCSLSGSSRNDQIRGTDGADRVDAGAGNDVVRSGGGADIVNGGAGNDRILAGAGNDTVNGGPGNDTIIAGPGRDRVDGGAGNDTIDLRDGEPDVLISCGSGVDTVIVDGGTQSARGCERIVRRR